MSKLTKIIIAVVALGFVGFLIWSIVSKSNIPTVDFSTYDPWTIYTDKAPAAKLPSGIATAQVDEGAGHIADHIKGGDIATAKVVLFEYADYQCPGCSTVNPWINQLLDEYEGQVALVYRTYLLSYHNNARASAAAANAAGLQGYWHEMADLLFAKQSEWEYATASARTDYFIKYFDQASAGQGDKAKFKADLASREVAAKIDFDYALAGIVTIPSTPAIYIDQKFIDWYDDANTEATFLEYFRNLISPLLAD